MADQALAYLRPEASSWEPAAEPARPWWRLPFGMFQTNLREIDATLDVEAVLDYIQQHGADAWLVNAGGILSFYPTDLPFQTRNPYLEQRPGGDMLGDAVRDLFDPRNEARTLVA